MTFPVPPAAPRTGRPRRAVQRSAVRRGAALRRGAAAALAAAALVLSGCTGTPAQSGPDPKATEGAPKGLEEFYTQSVDWAACESSFECAKVTVPVDYDAPEGETIEIALIRTKGSGSAGSLLVNPGGPGVSGYDMVKDSVTAMIPEKVRDAYTVVGFDPRGVKRSAPVTCLDAKGRDRMRATTVDPSTDAGLEKAFALQREVIDACVANTGPVLAHTDTESSARDMDVIRAAALGDTQLDYLGYSYGTFLGSAYAGLFPDRVGRFVLDGAMDPALDDRDIVLGQAKAFEAAIHSYARSCLEKSDCPLSGSEEEAVGQIRELLAAVKERPLPTVGARTVNSIDFVNGFILPLYNDRNWPALTQALAGALRGDGTTMLRLADIAADREGDGTYSSNSTYAFTAYNCLDYSNDADPAAMRAEAEDLMAASPTLGEFFAYSDVSCRDWPVKPVRTPAPAHYEGESTIVVVGTTGDPATPVEWAGALRGQLGNAALLTWEGEGHTAYGRGSECIDDAVDAYLIDGTVPKDGLRC
ncbi:alpha/beta hydrolase [Sinomonas halotolerans]|uniref:Alpha/beta hydrolase n=1 Tax=Sinomonas halotolerans TaxID=1644133 RepID=A0ABU9X3C8_9MICC